MTRWSLASVAAATALLLTTVHGQQPSRDRERERDKKNEKFVEGELLVQFRHGLSVSERNAALASKKAWRIRRFETLDIDLVRVPPGLSTALAAGGFRSMREIVFAQPNYIRHTTVTSNPPPNDPFWLDGSLWGLSKIEAQNVWTNYTAGDGSVIIADIDTGVDYTHPDLAANIWHNPLEIPGNGVDDDNNGYVDDIYGIDTANHDSNPYDDQGHGTHTAGTLAAVGSNNLGVTGVNWNAKLLPCKFLDAAGYGTDAGAVECFNYIVALRNRGENIRVTSNSWGEQRGSGQPAAALIAAIDAAGDAGIINVFGAGNDGSDNDLSPFDPASYPSPSIIAVASSGQTDRRSFFSNFGATSVDIAAPGENILSTYPNGQYQSLSGTSMATPHVAGVAALLAKMDPTLSVPAIKALLMNNVDQSSRWSGRVVSGGRLNAFRAATAVGTSPTNAPPSASLTGPQEGAVFKAPITITVDAVASDPDGSIQQVAFFANGSPLGADTTAPFSVAWSPAPGTYTLTAVATDDRFGTGTSSAVHITVLANAPPAVSIANPAAGTVFPAQSLIAIDADASDSDGGIQQVAFLVDGVVVSTDGVAPYSATWTGPLGTHTLSAVATDNAGATTTSTPVQIVILPLDNRINVALASNGGTATASSILGPKYGPSGAIDGDRKGLNWGNNGGWNDGTQNAGPDWIQIDFAGLKIVEEINVFSMQDNYTAPVTPTPTLTFSSFGLRGFEMQYWDGAVWLPVPNGVVTNNNLVWRQALFTPITTTRIRVFITQALNGYSRAMEVEAWGIPAGGNLPPDVSILSPGDDATFIAPASLTIDATASDSDGVVDHVDFYVDGALIGTTTAEPHTITWNSPVIGAHTLTAVATDNTGAKTTSAPVSVNIAPPNAPPSVTVTSPVDGATAIAPATISVAASAADSDGSVVSVSFYADGALIGTDNAAPFSVAWVSVPAGTYSITAVATDNSGDTATSAAVTFNVTAVPGRMNMALASNGGVATASSTLNPNYPASGAINGDRRGIGWGAGGGWNDGTQNASPDWLEVAFNGPKTIDEVNILSMQDNYTSPVEPTPTMTFTLWGLKGFDVQYWTGTAWQTVPNGTIANNNLVWRRVQFAAVTTTRMRVNITAALNGYSRVIEFEAWGIAAAVQPPPNTPPTVSLTQPSAGGLFIEPATITVSANAADADGTVNGVTFFANGALIGSDMTSPYSVTWSGVTAGPYAITAVATDNLGAMTASTAVQIVVNAPSPRINMAAAVNGGVATASSMLNANYPPSGAINGDRRGLSWGAGGGWNDGTQNASPDWLEVDFNGSKTIDEVSVFSMQDNYTAPLDPTPTMTFANWGLRSFEVQYWTGSGWATIPGATIVNNNLVWRKFTFTPVTTTRIRIFITAALNGYSRMVEVEAWGIAAPGGTH